MDHEDGLSWTVVVASDACPTRLSRALRKARQWGLPVQIGILAGFGQRTTPIPILTEKKRLSNEQGYGVIYFYWEGLWGKHSGTEGSELRKKAITNANKQNTNQSQQNNKQPKRN